jgi:hypothetical protein
MAKNSRKHILKFLTPLTPCVENCEYSWVPVSLENKKYKYIIYSVWITMARQHISPELNMKRFKKYCISSAVEGTMTCCRMTVGMIGVSMKRMKALTVKIVAVILIGKGR